MLPQDLTAEPQAEPPAVPTTDSVPNTPPAEFTPGGTKTQTNAKQSRGRREKTEFDLLSDIQEAFRGMPSNSARKRAWEWVTGWLGEEYAEPIPVTYPYSDNSVVSSVIRSMILDEGHTTHQENP